MPKIAIPNNAGSRIDSLPKPHLESVNPMAIQLSEEGFTRQIRWELGDWLIGETRVVAEMAELDQRKQRLSSRLSYLELLSISLHLAPRGKRSCR